jgi:signal transduction histidine kinase
VTSDRLCILLCANYAPELAALTSAGTLDVEFATYPARCGRPPLSWDDLRRATGAPDRFGRIAVFGSCCLTGLGDPPPDLTHCIIEIHTTCITIIAGEYAVERLIREGSHLVTPGWLAQWERHLADWGFDQQQSREFFAECCREVVLLDTGGEPADTGSHEAFARFIGKPWRSIPVGLDLLRMTFDRCRNAWVAECRDASHKELLASALRSSADYAMCFDMLCAIAQTFDTEQVALQTIRLYQALFGATDVAFVILDNGQPGELFRIGYVDWSDIELRRAVAVCLVKNRPNRHGGDQETIFLQIPGGADLLAVVMIDGLATPEYRQQYLDLALATVNICGLALNNARTYRLLQRNSEQLTQALVEATSAARAKNEFLANMSHEIRTPMNGVLGMLQLLQGTSLNTEQRDYLEIINTSANNLMRIFIDILDLTRVEAGKLKLSVGPFSLRETIAGIVSKIETESSAKGLVVTVTVSEEIPDLLLSDPVRIRQILLNLLGNAVKFTEQGSVTLSVTLDDLDEHAATIRLSVCDTGIGMSPDVVRTIFEPFTQADGSTTRRFGGTGLGLTICKRLTELMGGRIEVESTEGMGSAFHVTLPLRLMEIIRPKYIDAS